MHSPRGCSTSASTTCGARVELVFVQLARGWCQRFLGRWYNDVRDCL